MSELVVKLINEQHDPIPDRTVAAMQLRTSGLAELGSAASNALGKVRIKSLKPMRGMGSVFLTWSTDDPSLSAAALPIFAIGDSTTFDAGSVVVTDRKLMTLKVGDNTIEIRGLDARLFDLIGTSGVITDTAIGIQAVHHALKEQCCNVRLGSVCYDIKMVPDEHGRLRPATTEELKTLGNNLSSCRFDLHSESVVTPAEAPTAPQVPNVVGYTESMARRRLAEAGYHANVHFEVTDTAADAQRVIFQEPAAKSAFVKGKNLVTLTIGVQRKAIG